MKVIISIEGREAIPVRAIPLLTDWNVMWPDAVAKALAGDESCFGFEGLCAYRMEGGEAKPIRATWWQSFAVRDLKALSDKIKSDQVTHESGHQMWRKESLAELPAGVFVWKDEYVPLYQGRFGPDELARSLGREITQSERKARELDFAPFISAEHAALVKEGFAPQADKPQASTEAQPAPDGPVAGKDDCRVVGNDVHALADEFKSNDDTQTKASDADIIRITSLLNSGHKEDVIRSAIVSGTVKPVFHISELQHPFRCYSEDGMETYAPGQDPSDDFDDSPFEFYQGLVYLTVNAPTGVLDCDFHLFTKKTDADDGEDSLPRYSLDSHLTLEDVMRDGGLTERDAILLGGSAGSAIAKAIQPQAERANASHGPVMGPAAVKTPAAETGQAAPDLEPNRGSSTSIFKAMHGLIANDLSLAFVGDKPESGLGANNMLEVSARGQKTPVPLASLDLVDRRSGNPNGQCALLLGLAQGLHPKKSEENTQRMKRLRHVFLHHFGIDKDPFDRYMAATGWVPRFKIADRRGSADERAKKEAEERAVSLEQLAEQGIQLRARLDDEADVWMKENGHSY